MAARKKTKSKGKKAKKAKKVKKKKKTLARKKVARKAAKKKVAKKKRVKSKVKKSRPKARAKAAPRQSAPAPVVPVSTMNVAPLFIPPGERIGTVTHYFSHLSVAIVQLENGSLREGDLVHIKGHTTDFRQRVESMELDHAHVGEAHMGQSVGLRVSDHAREHDVVYKVV